MTAEDVEELSTPPQQEEDKYEVAQAGLIVDMSVPLLTFKDGAGKTDRLRLAPRPFAREKPRVLELSLL